MNFLFYVSMCQRINLVGMMLPFSWFHLRSRRLSRCGWEFDRILVSKTTC